MRYLRAWRRGHVLGRAPEKTGLGTTAPLVRSPYLRECGRYRYGAPRGAGASSDRCVPISPEPSGQARYRERLLGASSPSFRGRGKKRELRANPRARTKTVAEFLLLFDN